MNNYICVMRRNFLIFFLFIGLSSYTITAQIQHKVDFEKGKICIEINLKEKKISGNVAYTFDVLSAVDSIFLDAKNMDFSSVLLNGKKVKFINNKSHLIILKKFKKGTHHKITIEYKCNPKQTVYFIGYDNDIPENENREPIIKQIWTQGQGKYTSHWLPSFDDMNEKVEFDVSITFDEKYQVISNGNLIATSKEERKGIIWTFDMEKPMSSYLLAFAIGDYAKNTIMSGSGIPIDLYYYPQDSLRFEPTYRYTKTIFDFIENEIGVPYPWKNYKQVPVKDFLYAGMENTTATIFSDAYVIDSTAFMDKNYVNVNAHELAHQWFGNLVTEVDGNHHWLQEGFATYYALLAEKEIFGADFFYFKLYDTAEQLQAISLNNKGESLINAKASSLTFYEKGAWALVMLKNQIGETAFKKGIKNYLEKYKFRNVTIQNFLSEMGQASGKDLINFENDWLLGNAFPISQATSYLKNNSESLADFFELEETLKNILDDTFKTRFIEKAYTKSSSIALKKQLLLVYFPFFSEDFIKKELLVNNLKIRQAILLATNKISENSKEEYESLLFDKSYVTIESALYKLWLSFPENQKKYLDSTQDIIGLPDKHLRLLWLTLAIATPNYNSLKTKVYFDELSAYTNKTYSVETRQSAFEYLYQTLGLTDQNLRDLADASVHHSWQFKSFARNLLEELLKDPDYKNRFTKIVPMLNEEAQRYIKSKI